MLLRAGGSRLAAAQLEGSGAECSCARRPAALRLCELARSLEGARGVCGGLAAGFPALAPDHVGRIPGGPVMRRRTGAVLTVSLLSLAQQVGQRSDVKAAQPTAGKAGGDLLE